MKAGPVDVPHEICKNQSYTDDSFLNEQQVYWDGYNTGSERDSYASSMSTGFYFFRRWPDNFVSTNLFDVDNSISYTEVIQGGAETCYIMAAMGALGEFPELIRDTFITREKNSAGITAVRFYIRGKPWVVTVDDYMLFRYP